MIVLPTERQKAKSGNPRVMLIFGKPKCGKTSFAASLENNLLISLEGGAEFTNAMTLHVKTLNNLIEAAKAIKASNDLKGEGKKVYDYITIDDGTTLEKLAEDYALYLYQKTPMGKRKDGSLYNDHILKLPNGGGYLYLRLAFEELYRMFIPLTNHLIILCHSKLQTYDKDGIEMSEFDIDLTGKCKNLINRDCDAIGFMYRKENKTILNFKSGGNIVAGTRAEHLREKEVEVAESDENGNVTYYPERIFLPE